VGCRRWIADGGSRGLRMVERHCLMVFGPVVVGTGALDWRM